MNYTHPKKLPSQTAKYKVFCSIMVNSTLLTVTKNSNFLSEKILLLFTVLSYQNLIFQSTEIIPKK